MNDQNFYHTALSRSKKDKVKHRQAILTSRDNQKKMLLMSPLTIVCMVYIVSIYFFYTSC